MGTTLIFLASGEVVKKNPCLDKIWRKGKGKEAEFKYRLRERRTLFWGGVWISGGREVGSVVADN